MNDMESDVMQGRSACQTRGRSCFGCCGLLNLETNHRDLLQQRTNRFADVDLEDAKSIATFRTESEEKEISIRRKREDVYVCPFLGYISGESKIGCMVHPSQTGKPNLQNFSFYGASICLTYDCMNKDRDTDQEYSRLVEEFSHDHFEYTRLMADILFFESISRYFEIRSTWDIRIKQLFFRLCSLRLKVTSEVAITSFEIPLAKEELSWNSVFSVQCADEAEKIIREIQSLV